MANTCIYTEVIDTVLSGAPNDVLNAGIRKIIAGQSTQEEVALEVEISFNDTVP